MRGDPDTLAQAVIIAVEDQDLVIGSDHGVPVATLGETAGFGAVRQADGAWQRRRIFDGANYIWNADDNQYDDGYKTGNHRGGQDGDKHPQEPQIGGFA